MVVVNDDLFFYAHRKRWLVVILRITYLKEQGAEAAIISIEMVLRELVENINSAKQGNPVFNRQGEITGYRRAFPDVNRGLELLGNSLNMFKDGVVLEDRREELLLWMFPNCHRAG